MANTVIDYDNLITDDGGYPTDHALEVVSNFTGTPHELIDFIKKLWHWDDFVRVRSPWRGDIEVEFVTGGWSGNEDIISALGNTFFSFRFWESSHRGGKHVYRVPVAMWDTTSLIGKF